jgi:hypothetical protein
MEINNIEKPSVDNSPSKTILDTASPPQPRRDPVKENAEVNRPAAARRPQALMNAVTQSLNQAGLETSTATAVQGTEATPDAQTENNLETSQNEKVAQALQAFMHSLVEAMNSRRDQAGEQVATVTASTPAASNLEINAPKTADAYGGLVSRLEGLARKLEGTNGTSNGDGGLGQLNAAFENLASAATENGTGRQIEMPKLQNVLRNMVRNLQSTGDPTLASTGNVINTAA